MNYQTIKVRFQEPVCFLQLYRPEANNTINSSLIEECSQVLALCEESVKIVVLEGLPDAFCLGADFHGLHSQKENEQSIEHNPEPLYDLWLKLARGPYITISHVQGKANAGGVGFVAASDIVLADMRARFSLSELLFGLIPACVFPFLVRRIGLQKTQYMALMTQPVSVKDAYKWGLVDAYDEQSENLLRKHLLRLKRVPKDGILRYKRYVNELNDSIVELKALAVASNQAAFSDPRNLERIYRFVEKGQLS